MFKKLFNIPPKDQLQMLLENEDVNKKFFDEASSWSIIKHLWWRIVRTIQALLTPSLGVRPIIECAFLLHAPKDLEALVDKEWSQLTSADLKFLITHLKPKAKTDFFAKHLVFKLRTHTKTPWYQYRYDLIEQEILFPMFLSNCIFLPLFITWHFSNSKNDLFGTATLFFLGAYNLITLLKILINRGQKIKTHIYLMATLSWVMFLVTISI